METGFFVDWNGDTRRVEAPGDSYSCEVVQRYGHRCVDVRQSDGCTIFEATYYPTLEAVAEAGVVVNLI